MTGRHRLRIDAEGVFGLTWWAAIAAGLALLASIVHQETGDERSARGLAVTVLDPALAIDGGAWTAQAPGQAGSRRASEPTVDSLGLASHSPRSKQMYAIGMCVDESYLLPSLVTLTSLADSLAPSARRDVAVRVLTLDLSRQHAGTMAAVVKRCGFGSFDIQRQVPSAASVMADREYITVTTYLRFQFTPAFVARPHLLYVDADVLVTGDLSGPLHELPSDHVGAVRDEFIPAVGDSQALPGVVDRWPRLRGRPYYNAGMLWLPTAVLGRLRQGVEVALVRGRRHILHNDQDALNLWFLATAAVAPVAAAFNRFEIGRFLERGDWARRVIQRPLNAEATALHFVGGHKPWLACCPVTEGVRDYRAQAVRALRLVRRLGDQSVGVAGGVW